MFTASASEQWHKGDESEIFLECDGYRFRYVLDYMRDGKVVLPHSQSKAVILNELEYFGTRADENTVRKIAGGMYSFPFMIQRCTSELNNWIDDLLKDVFCQKLASRCYESSMESDSGILSYFHLYNAYDVHLTNGLIRTNEFLKEVGVKITDIKQSKSKSCKTIYSTYVTIVRLDAPNLRLGIINLKMDYYCQQLAAKRFYSFIHHSFLDTDL